MAVSLALDNAELARTFEEISSFQFDNGRLLIEDLKIKPGDTVLDIGCGTGRLGRHVAGIIGPFGSYIGIDPLADRVPLPRRRTSLPMPSIASETPRIWAFKTTALSKSHF